MPGSTLFDYVCAVTLAEGKPVLAHVYPSDKGPETRGILHFCWPDGGAALENMELTTRSENFSFVLTEGDGSKRFGYCRRFLRSSPPECLCVVSRLPSVALFQDLLNIVEMRSAQWEELCIEFLSACLDEPCPAPGERMHVRVPSMAGDGSLDDLHLVRPEVNEILLDYVTFFPLFSCVSVKNIVHLFSNALLERRIILVAENLSTLSSCVMAASNLLQPFHWQHVYIPVLPLVLIDYVTAPMPFFCGVLKSCLPMLETMPLEEVLVLDVENDKFLLDPGFEESLPSSDRKKLINTLRAIPIAPERDTDLQIASSFYQFFYDVFCGFESCYDLVNVAPAKNAPPSSEPTQGYRFDLAKFSATRSAPVRTFLEEFNNSQIMQSFLQESEPPERRYRFVSQQEYISHLAVSRDMEMAEAVRKVGAALGKAWSGVYEAAKEAAAKKRAEQRKESIQGSPSMSASTPIRIPDSENIDIILAREMTAKRLQAGGASSGRLGAPQTHRQCSSCSMYIDAGMHACPHCHQSQKSILVHLDPIVQTYENDSELDQEDIVASIKPLLEDRHRRPPPPPPAKKNIRKPPPPPKKPTKKVPMRTSIVPDISTLHLTLSEVFEEDDYINDEQYEEEYLETMAPEISAPIKPKPQPLTAQIVVAPEPRVARARASQNWVRPNNLDEEETPKLNRRAAPPPPPPPSKRREPSPIKKTTSTASLISSPKISPKSSSLSSSKSFGGSSPLPKAVVSPKISPKWCSKCGESRALCECTQLGRQSSASSSSSAAVCRRCNVRSERSDASFCQSCGEPMLAASKKVAALKVPAFTSVNDRSSRRRTCQCGHDNDIIAAQCSKCKEWF